MNRRNNDTPWLKPVSRWYLQLIIVTGDINVQLDSGGVNMSLNNVDYGTKSLHRYKKNLIVIVKR